MTRERLEEIAKLRASEIGEIVTEMHDIIALARRGLGAEMRPGCQVHWQPWDACAACEASEGQGRGDELRALREMVDAYQEMTKNLRRACELARDFESVVCFECVGPERIALRAALAAVGLPVEE